MITAISNSMSIAFALVILGSFALCGIALLREFYYRKHHSEQAELEWINRRLDDDND